MRARRAKSTFEFLAGEKLKQRIIKEVKKAKTFAGAIAFWGDGAERAISKSLLASKPRIICNLISGGTNPHVILKLKRGGAQIKLHDSLHAKV